MKLFLAKLFLQQFRLGTMLFGICLIAGALTANPKATTETTADYVVGFTIGRLIIGGAGAAILAAPFLLAGYIRGQLIRPSELPYSDSGAPKLGKNGSFFAAPPDDIVPLSILASQPISRTPPPETHKLGANIGVYTPRSKFFSKLCLFLLAAFTAILSGWIGTYWALGITAAWTKEDLGVVIGCALVVATGLGCMVWSVRPGLKLTVGLFHKGLAFDDGKKIEAVGWGEIEDLHIPFAMRDAAWTVTTYDGRRWKFTGNLHNNEHFIKTLTHDYLEEIVRYKLARIGSGETVKIGFYEVNRSGFGDKNRFLEWAQIESAIFLLVVGRSQSRKLRVNLKGKVFTWNSREMLSMPSWEVFHLVLQRVAPPHIWSKQAMPWL